MNKLVISFVALFLVVSVCMVGAVDIPYNSATGSPTKVDLGFEGEVTDIKHSSVNEGYFFVAGTNKTGTSNTALIQAYQFLSSTPEILLRDSWNSPSTVGIFADARIVEKDYSLFSNPSLYYALEPSSYSAPWPIAKTILTYHPAYSEDGSPDSFEVDEPEDVLFSAPQGSSWEFSTKAWSALPNPDMFSTDALLASDDQGSFTLGLVASSDFSYTSGYDDSTYDDVDPSNYSFMVSSGSSKIIDQDTIPRIVLNAMPFDQSTFGGLYAIGDDGFYTLGYDAGSFYAQRFTYSDSGENVHEESLIDTVDYSALPDVDFDETTASNLITGNVPVTDISYNELNDFVVAEDTGLIYTLGNSGDTILISVFEGENDVNYRLTDKVTDISITPENATGDVFAVDMLLLGDSLFVLAYDEGSQLTFLYELRLSTSSNYYYEPTLITYPQVSDFQPYVLSRKSNSFLVAGGTDTSGSGHSQLVYYPRLRDCYPDADNDGEFADETHTPITLYGTCGDDAQANPGFDCDDSDSTINTANGGCSCSSPLSCYVDADGDGYYNASQGVLSYCGGATCPEGYVQDSACQYDSITTGFSGCEDCDDSDPFAHYLCCGSGFHLSYPVIRSQQTTTGVADDYAFDEPVTQQDSSGMYEAFDEYAACCPQEDMCVLFDESDLVAGNNNIQRCRLSQVFGNYGGVNSDTTTPSSVCAVPVAPTSKQTTTGSVSAVPLQDVDSTVAGWFDCDDSASRCGTDCGLTWAQDGFSPWLYGSGILSFSTWDGSSVPSTLGNVGSSAFGEFSESPTQECCGDDVGETVITTSCNGSQVEAVCCPGPQYRALDIFGTGSYSCVKETSCPDRMRGAPTWVGAPDDVLIDSWSAGLVGSGYCCDGTQADVDNASKPLCVVNQRGCFVKTNSIGASLQDSANPRVICDATVTDSYCVIDANASDVSRCVRKTFYDDAKREIAYSSYDNPFKVEFEANANIVPLQTQYNLSTCNPQDRCSAVSVVEYTESNCVHICEKEQQFESVSAGSDSFTDCVKVCDVSLDEQIQYVGLNCYEGCDTYSVPGETSYTYDLSRVEDSTALNCSQEGCVETATLQQSLVKPVVEHYYYVQEDAYAHEEMHCDELTPTGSPADDVYCVQAQQNGMEVLLQDDSSGELFTCQGPQDTDNDFYHGDVWCPDGTILNNDLFTVSVCAQETETCDVGAVNNLVCDDPFSHPDDVWGLYEQDCFRTSSNEEYVEACCYMTQINEFNIYQWEEFEGVRIY